MMKMASSRMTVSASVRLAKESFRDLMIMTPGVHPQEILL